MRFLPVDDGPLPHLAVFAILSIRTKNTYGKFNTNFLKIYQWIESSTSDKFTKNLIKVFYEIKRCQNFTENLLNIT